MLAPVTVIVPDPAGAVTTPMPEGQVVVIFGGPATVTLAGSVSVKLIPDCAGLPAPLVNVKMSVDVSPWSIVVGLKTLFNEACTTVSVAWAVFPVPELAVTAPVVFTYTPAVFEVTVVTLNVHDAPAPNSPAARVIVFVPDTVSVLPAPHILFCVPLVAVTFAGKTSVKATLLIAASCGLVTVNCRIVVAPGPIGVVKNCFARVGGLGFTTIVAVTAGVVPAFVVETAPVLFSFEPILFAVTFTVYWQVVPAGTVPPASDREFPPFTAVRVPVQPVPFMVGFALAVLIRPAGYVSVNDIPVVASVCVFWRVMASTEVSPIKIGETEKDFAATSLLRIVLLSLADLETPEIVTVAVLVSVPTGLPELNVALMEKVMLLPIGIFGMAIPAPCMAATVEEAGQVAPPAAEHVTLLAVRLATAGSLKTAPDTTSPVSFVIVTA